MEFATGKMQWWEEKKNNVHAALFATAQRNVDNLRSRHGDFLRWFRLYGNYPARGLTANAYSKSINPGGSTNRLTWNVVQSCVDTVQAKIAKNKPKPTFLTSGGSWSQRKKSKLLDKWCQGQFYATNLYEKTAEQFRDCAVFGTGILYVFIENGKICVERVFPEEIVIDEMEAVFGAPQSLYRRRAVHRDKLLAAFPEKKQLIKNALPASMPNATKEDRADLVAVVEGWHLKSGKDAKDGRHVLALDNVTLVDDEYEEDYFPFPTIRWTKPLRGWFGQGLAEQLMGIQYEINKILRQIQQSIPWAVPKCFVESGSKVNKGALNDELGGIIDYTGTPPQIMGMSVISPELFNQLDRLERSAYNITGISQLSAQSKKPAGLESGVALREMNDIESERFIMAGKAYEELHLEIARQMLRLGRKLYEDDKKYSVSAPDRHRTIQIKWKDIALDEDDYVMKIYPTSSLPQTPPGRLQMVEDLSNLGLIPRDAMLGLLDFPDLEAFNQLQEADHEFCDMQMESIVEEGVFIAPEPFQDLNYALKTAQQTYLLVATMSDVSPDNKDLLRRYMAQVSDRLAAMAPPPMPGAMPGMGAPPPGAAAPGGPGGPGAPPPAGPMPPMPM